MNKQVISITLIAGATLLLVACVDGPATPRVVLPGDFPEYHPMYCYVWEHQQHLEGLARGYVSPSERRTYAVEATRCILDHDDGISAIYDLIYKPESLEALKSGETELPVFHFYQLILEDPVRLPAEHPLACHVEAFEIVAKSTERQSLTDRDFNRLADLQECSISGSREFNEYVDLYVELPEEDPRATSATPTPTAVPPATATQTAPKPTPTPRIPVGTSVATPTMRPVVVVEPLSFPEDHPFGCSIKFYAHMEAAVERGEILSDETSEVERLYRCHRSNESRVRLLDELIDEIWYLRESYADPRADEIRAAGITIPEVSSRLPAGHPYACGLIAYERMLEVLIRGFLTPSDRGSLRSLNECTAKRIWEADRVKYAAKELNDYPGTKTGDGW